MATTSQRRPAHGLLQSSWSASGSWTWPTTCSRVHAGHFSATSPPGTTARREPPTHSSRSSWPSETSSATQQAPTTNSTAPSNSHKPKRVTSSVQISRAVSSSQLSFSSFFVSLCSLAWKTLSLRHVGMRTITKTTAFRGRGFRALVNSAVRFGV